MKQLPATRARAHRNLVLFALAGVLATTAPAWASHVGEDSQVDQQSVAATDQLLWALRQWENAPEAVRAARLQHLVQRAAERQERLLRLLERNPQVAAARLLPTALRERLPAAARTFVEEDVTLRGDVFAEVASDVQSGMARQRFLMRANGNTFELKMGDSHGGERDLLGWSGRNVVLTAARIDGHLLVRNKRDVQLLAADGTVAADGFTTPVITPRVTGNQNTLVILANFTDRSLTCTAADVQTRVFGTSGSTVHTAMQQSSRNLVGFTGTVAGPFPIAYSSTGACNYSGWASAAEAAARAAGVDPSQYSRVNYVTPSNSTCGWSGLAYMPGRQSWVQSCGSTGVYTHELGHNLSLHHAGSPTAEYGDGSDPMGGARNVRNNGANQVMAGWVPTGGVLDVTSGGGSFSIAALGPEAGTQPQVLRLVKADTNEKYYVSLRQALGLDSGLLAGHLNTVSVHKASGTLPAKSVLLANLAVGQSFTDSVNGIVLNHVALIGGVSSVDVTMSGGTCSRAAPSVSLNPGSRTAAPGATASYSATIVNNNPAACGSSTFVLTQALPAGLTGTFSAPSLNLAAGASGTSTWNVASAGSTADANYGIDLTASENAVSNSRTVHASLVVYRDITAPALTVTSPVANAVLSGAKATLSATASDASGITAVEFYDGATLIGRDTSSPYSMSWTLRKVSKGAHTITVTAIDAAGNRLSQTRSVTIN